MRLKKKLGYYLESVSNKGSSRLNEDAFSINDKDQTFAVFDGATSLIPFTNSAGKTGAYLASNIAKSIFDEGGKDLKSLVMEVNDKIRAEMISNGIDLSDKLNLWGTTAAAVRLHPGRFEWLQIADTNILVVYRDGSSRFLVETSGHDQRALMRLKSLIASGSADPLKELMPDLVAQRRRLNVTYGVIAGEDEVKFIKTGSERLDGVKAILIFSDGMLIPQASPEIKATSDEIANAYAAGGLEGWLATVRSMEDADMAMARYPRFKPHDDATAIAIEFD